MLFRSEGPTDDSAILALRQQQAKNLITILLMSQGTPMVLMGDEVRRSQQGNNNAYCQDGALTWLDWGDLDRQQGLWQFTRDAIALIQHLKLFQQTSWLTVTDRFVSGPHIIWHGVKLYEPDWGDDSHSLAFTLHHPAVGEDIHVILNAYWETLGFDLPPLPVHTRWHLLIDTSIPSPGDLVAPTEAVPIAGGRYLVKARTSVVLMALPI